MFVGEQVVGIVAARAVVAEGTQAETPDETTGHRTVLSVGPTRRPVEDLVDIKSSERPTLALDLDGRVWHHKDLVGIDLHQIGLGHVEPDRVVEE